MRLRIFQIRALASFLNSLGNLPSGRNLIVRLRSNRLMRSALDVCLGFRRTFPSFAAAQTCSSRFIQAGHEHPDEIRFHTSMSDVVRESDYPVLFHFAPLLPELRTVFDLGGNVGNLFYSYQQKLAFPPDFRWIVYDLPVKRSVCEKLAVQRGETRLRFCDALGEASGCDVFIASGSLHYFEEPLYRMLAGLQAPPAHVFVNRTPFSIGPDLITVQDNHSYLVPCKLHSRAALLGGMRALGYELQSEWPVHERRLSAPMHPDICARTYSGFYFRRK